MRRLSPAELDQLSNEWLKMHQCPPDEEQAFYSRLEAVPCMIAFPLGEILNPRLKVHMWLLNIKGIPKPVPMTKQHRFNAQSLEGCIEVANQDLATALLMWREMTDPHRINIFVEGKFKMNEFVANVISIMKVQKELQQLLKTYLSEKAENQRDKDEHGIEYWDGACQTIYEVAAALTISLEVKQGEPQ